MAHYLTFSGSMFCTVNGVSVESGYELHDGDVIDVIVNGTSGLAFYVNNEYCVDGGSVDIYDSDVDVSPAPGSGGSN